MMIETIKTMNIIHRSYDDLVHRIVGILHHMQGFESKKVGRRNMEFFIKGVKIGYVKGNRAYFVNKNLEFTEVDQFAIDDPKILFCGVQSCYARQIGKEPVLFQEFDPENYKEPFFYREKDDVGDCERYL